MESLTTIMIEILPAIILLAGIVVGIIVKSFFKNKDGLMTEKLATEKLLESIVSQGVNYAEHMSKVRKKTSLETGSQDKLYTAIDYIEEMLESSGVLAIAKKELASRIEAAINKEKV